MNNNKQLEFGVVLSYIQVIFAALMGLFYTPLLISKLGTSEYGLYNTISSTISLMSILSMGFNSSYIRYFSAYKKNDDEKSIAQLNTLFIKIFVVIGIIALLCGLYLTNNLELIFDKGLTTSEYSTARTLMLLLTTSLAFSFPMSVFQSIISAHERFVVLKLLSMMKNIVAPLLTIPILCMGFKSVGMTITIVAVNAIVDISYAIYAMAVLDQKFILQRTDISLLKDLFVYTGFIAINIIVDQINWNVDKVLLGRFRGTLSVSVYSVGFTLYLAYQTISTAISSVFSPRIFRIVNVYEHDVKKRNDELTSLFVRVGRIQFMVISCMALYVVMFGRDFIHFWVGDKFTEAYYVALLLILPATVPLIQNVGIDIQRGLNKHKFRSIAYLIMAILNLFLSVVLCQKYGAVGAAFGTAVSLVLVNGLLINVYYEKACGINVKLFWKNILILFKGLILPIILGITVKKMVIVDNMAKLIAVTAIYLATYLVSVWFVSMNDNERGLIRSAISRV